MAPVLSLVWFQGRWLTPNVYTVPLGPCDVDWHVDRGIVALACVGRDRFRVWPLPVEQPWWEDAPETPDGELACRVQDHSCRNAQTRFFNSEGMLKAQQEDVDFLIAYDQRDARHHDSSPAGEGLAVDGADGILASRVVYFA